MAKQKRVEFHITEGPSKDALIAAVFFHSEKTPHQVTFTLAPTVETAKFYGGASCVYEVVITGVERRNENSNSWNLKGQVCGAGFDFTCHYDGTRRKGHFTCMVEA